jgi:hypothetical protein
MRRVALKLMRFDREPGGDHYYGPAIDRLLDSLAGGTAKLDRSSPSPVIELKAARLQVELHEDGPLLHTIVEKLPEAINAVAALISAWCAWRTLRKDISKEAAAAYRRTVEISVGKHKYAGRPSPAQAKRIARFLATLEE